MSDQTSWHVPDEVLVEYAREEASTPDAWSVEAHLTSCAMCRESLAGLVAFSPLAELLATSRAGLTVRLTEVPTQRHAVTQPTRLILGSVGRWPWLLAVVTALAAAIGVSRLFEVLHPHDQAVSLTWALAPIVPLAGVALTFVRRSDPWREVVVSTPTQGLTLVLWRCAIVLVAAAPLTLAVGQAPGIGAGRPAVSSGMAMLAMLALTLVALALGTQMGLETATLVVAGCWCVLTVFPLVVADRAWLNTLSPTTLPAWVAIVVGSAVVVGLRRSAFERLPTFSVLRTAVR